MTLPLRHKAIYNEDQYDELASLKNNSRFSTPENIKENHDRDRGRIPSLYLALETNDNPAYMLSKVRAL